ncbi:hypothetical protein BGX20_004543 [Mortierella sp. AD010]|nr:hypothetical protein BGX20_004543 [Mortierella sp. AD010]
MGIAAPNASLQMIGRLLAYSLSEVTEILMWCIVCSTPNVGLQMIGRLLAYSLSGVMGNSSLVHTVSEIDFSEIDEPDLVQDPKLVYFSGFWYGAV